MISGEGYWRVVVTDNRGTFYVNKILISRIGDSMWYRASLGKSFAVSSDPRSAVIDVAYSLSMKICEIVPPEVEPCYLKKLRADALSDYIGDVAARGRLIEAADVACDAADRLMLVGEFAEVRELMERLMSMELPAEVIVPFLHICRDGHLSVGTELYRSACADTMRTLKSKWSLEPDRLDRIDRSLDIR